MASRKMRFKSIHEVSSDSEQELDPFADRDGDYDTDENYEPEANCSSSSEDIFDIAPRPRPRSRAQVASSDSSKSSLSHYSDSYISDNDLITQEFQPSTNRQGSSNVPEDQASTSRQVSSNVTEDQASTSQQVSSNVLEDQPSTSRQVSSNVTEDQASTSQQVSSNVLEDQPNTSRQVSSNVLENQPRTTQTQEDPWTTTTTDIPEFDFDSNSSGPQFNYDSSTTIEQMFNIVFTQEMLDYLTQCSNAYGNNLCNSNRPRTRNSRALTFKEITSDEMKKFLGLSLLHGHVRIPKQQKLFTYDDPLYFHPIFPYTMSSRRYEQILRCLYAAEIGAKGSGKINNLIDILTTNFRAVFKPPKELSLDESLLLYRGRLQFRQYIKSKKARYGIKFYVLATSDGYVLNMKMYSGTDESASERKLDNLVIHLMQPYLLKGHELFMDNYYNSVTLSQKLLDLKTHTNGTLRVNRKDNPKDIVAQKLNKGQHVWVRKNKVYVSKWVDKRPVIMLTTRNHPRMTEVRNRFGRAAKKPIEVATYNKFMSGVDRSDQMISYYSSPRKTIRWYKKVFFHLLDLAIWNAYYLYKKFVLNNEKYEFCQYREKLIKHLLGLKDGFTGNDLVANLPKKHNNRKQTTAQNNENGTAPIQPVVNEPEKQQIEQGHWPRREPAGENSKKKYSFLCCRVCSKLRKKRVETSYRCIGCPDLPPLCPECFMYYEHKYVEQQE